MARPIAEAEQMDQTTISAIIDGGIPFGRTAWLATHRGLVRIGYIRWPDSDPWAVCPAENGGLGFSYCVGGRDLVYLAVE